MFSALCCIGQPILALPRTYLPSCSTSSYSRAMSSELVQGSPLVEALRTAMQPKLAETGWTSGADDTTLSDYIILMIINGNDEQTLASELANDLLDLGPDSGDAVRFSRWLFDTMDSLRNKMSGNGGQDETVVPDAPVQSQTENTQNVQEPQAASNDAPMNLEAPTDTQPQTNTQDSEMGEAASELNPIAIPTGPKAMRNGSGSGIPSKAPRGDKRMLNQLNRHLDRDNDSPLHRIRGTSGTGRINSHSSREPPKGPRNSQVGRGIAAMQNGRGMGGQAMGAMGAANNMAAMGGIPAIGSVNNMAAMGGMPPMGMPGMAPMPDLSHLTPQQRLAMYQIFEQQAQMMHQVFNGQAPTPHFNPNFQGGTRPGPKPQSNGKSIFDSRDKTFKGKHNLPPSTKFTKKQGQDEKMADVSSPGASGDSNEMEVDSGRTDPTTTMCRFNLSCTKADCPFAHQSPAAPSGTTVDMNDTCSFGIACTNHKCVGKHPSPAQRKHHQTEVDCIFYPNCRDMVNCPYRHPSMPPCRNGADCTVPNCKFAHSKVMCRFSPCMNKFCSYKHAEGQKKTFEDKVWINPKKEGEHVSERKFVDENAEEELIIPGQAENVDTEIIT